MVKTWIFIRSLSVLQSWQCHGFSPFCCCTAIWQFSAQNPDCLDLHMNVRAAISNARAWLEMLGRKHSWSWTCRNPLSHAAWHEQLMNCGEFHDGCKSVVLHALFELWVTACMHRNGSHINMFLQMVCISCRMPRWSGWFLLHLGLLSMEWTWKFCVPRELEVLHPQSPSTCCILWKMEGECPHMTGNHHCVVLMQEQKDGWHLDWGVSRFLCHRTWWMCIQSIHTWDHHWSVSSWVQKQQEFLGWMCTQCASAPLIQENKMSDLSFVPEVVASVWLLCKHLIWQQAFLTCFFSCNGFLTSSPKCSSSMSGSLKPSGGLCMPSGGSGREPGLEGDNFPHWSENSSACSP